MCEEYNGYTNRETWATGLHIDNDYGLYLATEEVATELVSGSGSESAVRLMADYLEELVTEISESVFYPEGETPASEGARLMLSDIGSVYRVNFRELAEGYIETAQSELSAQ